jgi:hypothetical protein
LAPQAGSDGGWTRRRGNVPVLCSIDQCFHLKILMRCSRVINDLTVMRGVTNRMIILLILFIINVGQKIIIL